MAYRNYREVLKSAAPSWQAPVASPGLFGLDDVYGGNLDDVLEVDAGDGGATRFGRWTEL